MKHYKDPDTNELYAYEPDGSQDHLIPTQLVAITDEEADAIRNQIFAEALAKTPVLDATTKLAEFLNANPDVAALIQQK